MQYKEDTDKADIESFLTDIDPTTGKKYTDEMIKYYYNLRVADDGHLLKYIQDKYKTVEMCVNAVKQNKKFLEYVPENLKSTVESKCSDSSCSVMGGKSRKRSKKSKRTKRKYR
jgi:hypothetical protein